MAALALLTPAEPELSLSPHHLDVAPRLLSDSHVAPEPEEEAEPEPLMMAQPVPHQTTDKKRVKVYELRDNDWFDRGTGFCFACFVPVCCRSLPSLENLLSSVTDHVPLATFRSKMAKRRNPA